MLWWKNYWPKEVENCIEERRAGERNICIYKDMAFSMYLAFKKTAVRLPEDVYKRQALSPIYENDI